MAREESSFIYCLVPSLHDHSSPPPAVMRIFLVNDIIILDTLLRKYVLECQQWYMVGTCKVVKQPFQQLFTIHTVVEKRPCFQEFLLVFGKRDYSAPFSVVLRQLPCPPAIKTSIWDY